MIGMRTMLEVADNSGARKLMCILPRGGDLGLRAGLGDVITASVKEATPESAIKKGKVVRCVVVRMRKETRRKDGTYIRFDSNKEIHEDCLARAGGYLNHGEKNSTAASAPAQGQAENQDQEGRYRQGDRGS